MNGAGVVLILIAGTLLAFGRERHPLRTRVAWMTVWIGVAVSALLPNPFLGIMGALIFLNVWRHEKPSSLVPSILYPSLAFLGAYGILSPQFSTDLVPWALWTMALLGCWMGLWAACSVAYLPLQYGPPVPTINAGYRIGFGHPGGLLRFYEAHHVEAGQANPNHLDALASLNVAAVVGLYHIGYTLALLLLPLVAFPVFALVWWPRGRVRGRAASPEERAFAWSVRRPTMGVVFVFTLAMAWLSITVPHGGWLAVGGLLCAFVGLARFNNTRFGVWGEMLTNYWLRQSWGVKLIGCGTDAWANLHNWHLANHENPEDRFLYESAHNEYVQQLVEHGLIGLLAMLGYCASALWIAAHAGPVGQAVYLVGSVMVAIAFLHFPWTFFHQIQLKGLDGKMHTYEHGSPGLIAYSFVLVLMLEAVR